MGANGSFELTGHSNPINGEHNTAFGVEGDMMKRSGMLFQFHGSKCISLSVHLGIKRTVLVGDVVVLMAENMCKFWEGREVVHEVKDQYEGVPFRGEGSAVFGKGEFLEGGLFLNKSKVVAADGKGTSHWELAEGKGKFDKSQA